MGPGGSPDWKSRASRALGAWLERPVIAAADGLMAVSTGTYESIQARLPRAATLPCAAIPYGFEPRDFEALSARSPRPRRFDPHDGLVHLGYIGTVPPLGDETLRALFAALGQVRSHRPALAERARLHFFGTTSRTGEGLPERVLPLARAAGVADLVTEVPERLPYLEALALHRDATALLLLGSTEPHYTASRLFPVLQAARPIVAVFHAASSVVEILRAATAPPFARLITYDDQARAEACVPQIASALEALLADLPAGPPPTLHAIAGYQAARLAGDMAQLLDQVA
jgi:hypothetical protein